MRTGVIVDNDLNDDKRVLREIEALSGAGFEIFVLCFAFSGKSYRETGGIKVTRIRISKGMKNVLFFFLNTIPAYGWLWSGKIKKFITGNDLDSLHVHDLYMSEAAYRGIRKSGKDIPMILDLHENYSYAVTTYNWTKGFLRSFITRPQKWQKKEERLLQYPKGIVVLSEEFRDHLLTKYKFLAATRFCAFPNVPDMIQLDDFKAKAVNVAFEKKDPVVFYFGVVAERRGIFNAIDAFAEVISKGYNADLVIVGPIDKKDRDRFFEMTGIPGIRSRVKYIPWIDLSELPAYLEASDICLAPFIRNPQHDSGVANKIFDYMSGKRPVIASDCLPQKRLIEKYECGLIFGNQREFVDAIIELLTNPELRHRMGENGYKAITSEYNLEMKKSGLISFYRELLNN
ncbi:MAG: glycosyltransferase family 4 protein [Bacteroidota bacterium]|nr:glycosyltransferase family 4 protein [Bacteroidota bacterium]